MCKRLKELRERRNKTGQEIADRIGISTSYYFDLESGRGRLNENVLIKLADYFNTTTDYILERSDNEKRHKLERLTDNIDIKDIELLKIIKDKGIPLSKLYEIYDILKAAERYHSEEAYYYI